MTVRELIEVLSNVDPQIHVVLCINQPDNPITNDADLVYIYAYPGELVLADETVVDALGGVLVN